MSNWDSVEFRWGPIYPCIPTKTPPMAGLMCLAFRFEPDFIYGNIWEGVRMIDELQKI
ncbi:MAG: hypothetical protein ACUVXI_00440 [bacterium]